MPQPTRAEAIKRLLVARTHPDLASLYHAGMEVQVNVARDEGHRAEGRKAYSDGATTWYAFRIPKRAWQEPEDNSGQPMTWALSEHAEGIGMTGWCFTELRSRWVAFDFDAIVGHSERHKKKLTDAELARVQDAACLIPWVQVRRSASGNALHLYVHFDPPVPTKNHTEHSALAKAVLAEMSVLAGHDFDAQVDACGGNMWTWHRKMPKSGRGLELVRDAERPLDRAPAGWQRYVRVTKGERKKSLPEFAEAKPASFDETAGQQPRVPLDAEHKSHVDWLLANQGWGWWDADHHMLVTHTHHLKRLHDSFLAAGNPMRGHFKTSSPATQPDEQNCFCFPMRGGSWSVRRYSIGAAEDPSWDQDGKGWTRCYFNRDPDLRAAARAKGGVETAQGSFQFPCLEDAGEVVRLVGGDLKVPNIVGSRPGRILPHKDGRRVIVEVDQFQQDSPKEMLGWYSEKGKAWRIVVNANAKLEADNEVGTFDELIRHATNESRVDAGWFVKVGDHWNSEPKSNVAVALSSIGKKKAEVDALMGASVLKPWVIVSRPFEDEYPGDREWNRSKVRLKYPRSEEVGDFSTWRRVLGHIGRDLDDALANDGWALANDVKSGGEYLELWLASSIQKPYLPTPYIFLWSEEQDTGKSTFHEILPLIVTEDGIVEANKVVEGKDTFNGQMEVAIFCYIEELDLQKNKGAYSRIKNWVTSPRIAIRHLYVDAYQSTNNTHWIHCANKHSAVPLLPGDTRVTMINVHPLGPKEMIPKPELMEMLKREAPHFMNHLLQLEVPPSGSRLAVPVINTSEKCAIAASTMNNLEDFIDERCHHAPGEAIKYSEFLDKFKESLDPMDLAEWQSRHKVSSAMPPKFPIGKRGPDTYVGNISWDKPTTVGPRLVLNKRQLVPVNRAAPRVEPAVKVIEVCKSIKDGHVCARSVSHEPPHESDVGVQW